MSKVLTTYAVIVLLLTSCSSPLFASPTPTATSTLTPVPTATITHTPTPTLTPPPTNTRTPRPTATITPTLTFPLASVKSRDQFEELVVSGAIKCKGASQDGTLAIGRLLQDAQAAGLIPNGAYTLGAGIPSTENPSLCIFLITFYDGNSIIIYKDGETGKFIKLPIED